MRLPVFSTTLPLLDTGPKSIAAVRVLRISVTDRCNFRCVYCMPEEGVRWLPKEDILSFEEIADVVKAAIEVHGIRRFKLTGGEPTLRHGIVDLVRMLRRIEGIEDLSLTTNGFLLEDLAGALKESGLDRVTVSIDSLRADRFKRITRTGDLATVMNGLERAEDVGLLPLKVNCVTMRGTNDDELVDFAKLSIERQLTVRFIEYMPLGDAALLRLQEDRRTEVRPPNADQQADFSPPVKVDSSEVGPAGGCGAQDRGADALIPENEVRDTIERELGPLLPVEPETEAGVGPAKVFALAKGNPKGRVGFISAMSAPFCSTCNRLRLTANGILRSCLFEGGEVDIRPILRTSAASRERQRAVAQAMTDCVRLKPDVHSHRGKEQMSRIGG
jgi:cyclic pyranopterin phosphate synthase